ncbi:MAG: chemotaxis protein, partial [Thiotrichales bacterium]|nr:chemotaxis protein [Thiotrichales bacterium]
MTTSVMEGVNARTQLVGQNRLELLLFNLGCEQRFGINVFKVREVIKCPPLTQAPHSHQVIRGMANIRGQTITIMDLAMAIGKAPITELDDIYTIITEYNRHIQGFLVSGVDRIVNLNWETIKPPPGGLGGRNFLTAVTQIKGDLVEIIDVEKVLGDVLGYSSQISDSVTESSDMSDLSGSNVLVVDDSAMARKQIVRVLEQMGIRYTVAKNGREAFNMLTDWITKN